MNIESQNKAVKIAEKIRGNCSTKSKVESEIYALNEARKMLKDNEINKEEFNQVLQEVCRW